LAAQATLMPELPEVETTRRGIAPHLEGSVLRGAIVRQPRLRYPVTPGLASRLEGHTVREVSRRGKYLLVETGDGGLILHLGMSGSLRVLPAGTPAGPHDHVDILFDDRCLRLRDPRRFGLVLWTAGAPQEHHLLRSLGPEPLGSAFCGDYLQRVGRSRHIAIKNLIMDSRVVVGIGNIYASEALFAAGIHPRRPTDRISRARYVTLVDAIRQVLSRAIRHGGTTLRDFVQEDGRPGYFRHELRVYDRAGQPCPACGLPVRRLVIGQRSTFYCSHCQH
jgi:formamidopyrimidine-DNA glycosylase